LGHEPDLARRVRSDAAAVARPAAGHTTAPLISLIGTLEVGRQVACNTGTWTGAATYARQWLRGDAPIPGETAIAYTL
jgi:hypothetical protein